MRADWKVTVSGQPAREAPTSPGLQDADDRTIVRAVVGGDRDAFDLIVERHRRAVYQICYRYVGNHEDASDLTQDVFLRAFRGLPRFKGQASIRTWLYRIAVNASLNRVAARPRATEPVEESRQIDPRAPDPSAGVQREETRRRVRAAIARLPKRQRAVLILRVYQELPHQEIAAVLGGSTGAVKANFFHALNNLKKLLQAP